MGTCPSKTQSWLEAAALSVRAAWAPFSVSCVFDLNFVFLRQSLMAGFDWQCMLAETHGQSTKRAWQFHCNMAVLFTMFFLPNMWNTSSIHSPELSANSFAVWLAVFCWHYLPGSPSLWERGSTWRSGTQIAPQTKREGLWYLRMERTNEDFVSWWHH